MAPRAMWKGQMRLSLVTFGVRMYSATESSRRVSMNQLHAECHQRLKQQMTCPVHGPVTRDEIVKGYEYEKDTYVIVEPSDLEEIRLESNKTIELVEFVDAGAIDSMLVDSPYYIGPDGPVAEEPFGVIREALKKMKKVGIGKIVMQNRERIVSVSPHGLGFKLETLRYANEIRSADQFFAELKKLEADAEMLKLAETIIESKTSKAFDASKYEDKYRDAFFEMVKAKVAGEEPVIVDDEVESTSFNFMDALKASVEQAGSDMPAETMAKSKKKTKKSKAAKKPAAKSVSGKKKSKKQESA